MHRSRTPLPARAAARAIPTVLIVVSVALQGIAATRILCPPRSIAALAALRIACTPRLWPFIDYPTFSEPHVHGDVLAWLDAQIESANGERTSRGVYCTSARTCSWACCSPPFPRCVW